jgi:hypothetical protein
MVVAGFAGVAGLKHGGEVQRRPGHDSDVLVAPVLVWMNGSVLRAPGDPPNTVTRSNVSFVSSSHGGD